MFCIEILHACMSAQRGVWTGQIWDSGTRKELGLSLHVDITLVLGRTLPAQQSLVREGLQCSFSDMARVTFAFGPGSLFQLSWQLV
jgi:hypothetical protein